LIDLWRLTNYVFNIGLMLRIMAGVIVTLSLRYRYRLMTDEEKRLANMEATIESKDARAKALQREKEEQIQRVSTISLIHTPYMAR